MKKCHLTSQYLFIISITIVSILDNNFSICSRFNIKSYSNLNSKDYNENEIENKRIDKNNQLSLIESLKLVLNNSNIIDRNHRILNRNMNKNKINLKDQEKQGVSSLNISPISDIGMIYLKLLENKNFYSFGLENNQFKIKSNNKEDKLVLTNKKIEMNSSSIIMNTMSILGKIFYNYSYKIVKPVEPTATDSNSGSQSSSSDISTPIKYEFVEKKISQTQWRMIMHDDFKQNKTSYDWNYSLNTKCGDYYSILGGFYQTSTTTLEKTISYFPTHRAVMIELNAHMFGKWSGETMYIQIDTNESKFEPKYYWTMRCETPKVAPKIKMCGEYEYCKLGEKVMISLNHSSSYMKIIIGSTLQSNPSLQSFGISNFKVYVK